MAYTRGGDTKQLVRRIQGGLRAGGPMGAFAGFMGLPFFARSGISDTTPHGSSAGHGRMFYPGNNYGFGFGGFGSGGNGGGGNGGGGGDGGGDGSGGGGSGDSGLPGDKFGKNLIPEWWKQWYRTQGQYGGVPPVQGLL